MFYKVIDHPTHGPIVLVRLKQYAPDGGDAVRIMLEVPEPSEVKTVDILQSFAPTEAGSAEATVFMNCADVEYMDMILEGLPDIIEHYLSERAAIAAETEPTVKH